MALHGRPYKPSCQAFLTRSGTFKLDAVLVGRWDCQLLGLGGGKCRRGRREVSGEA